MEDDDDMIVVIVGDDDESVADLNSIQIKHEVKQEVMDLEDILETVQKHGQFIDYGRTIKTESLDENEYLDDEEYVPDKDDYRDEDDEFIPDEDEDDDVEIPKKRNKKCYKRNMNWRRRMMNENERVSFVQDLIQQYPQLVDDEELLIETLCEIMKSIKVPDPPEDYYVRNEILFECTICDTLSDTLPAAARHYQEKHGTRYLVCYACGADFRSTTNLYKHEKRCTAPDATIVLKARALFVGNKGRSRPFLLKPEELAKYKKVYKPTPRSFPCSQCSAVFASKQTLQSHEYKHSGKRPFQCDKCPAAYTSPTALGRHSVKHSGLKFTCDHCSRSFKTKATIIAHMDTHLPQKKYGCEECGRRFAQRMALRLHVHRTHLNLPNPYPCRLCPRRYPRMSVLKAHMLKEHGMQLMTRNMFFKRLPTMSETELKQAKVFLKSEVEAVELYPHIKDLKTYPKQKKQVENYNYDFQNTEGNESNDNGNDDFEQSQYSETGEVQYDIVEGIDKQEGDLSAEVMEYIQKLQADGGNHKDVKVVIIQNGKMVNIDGTEVETHGILEKDMTTQVESVLNENIEQEYKFSPNIIESNQQYSQKLNDKRKQSFEPKVEVLPIEFVPQTFQDDRITRSSKKKNKTKTVQMLKRGSKQSMPAL